MNWQLIIKDKSNQPKEGKYNDWKEQIAKECFYQCIYCSIHEAQFGGIDHYHIEHYKPKSLKQFKDLEDDIMNLFYSCPICNRFKSNDWPNDPVHLDIVSYPDPSKHNYSDLFEINSKTYKVSGRYTSTKYMTERLFLNRPQLLYERREFFLRKKEDLISNSIKKLSENLDSSSDFALLKEILDIVLALKTLLTKRESIRPYKLAEIRK